MMLLWPSFVRCWLVGHQGILKQQRAGPGPGLHTLVWECDHCHKSLGETTVRELRPDQVYDPFRHDGIKR
jgi:hypothetical protein